MRAGREYVENTVILVTTFSAEGGEARVLDCFLVPPADRRSDARRLMRVVEGLRGTVGFSLRIAPRFDYAEITPWIRRHGRSAFSATGGDDGLIIWSDARLEQDGEADPTAQISVRAGQRARVLIRYLRPEEIDAGGSEEPRPDELDRALEKTHDWWSEWATGVRGRGSDRAGAMRSALTLKCLSYAPTGAIVAAPTTSLPESPGARRNWDYRYAWIRDSGLASRSLADLGCETEADAFRRFIERSTAGRADDLRILYGIGGERWVGEQEVPYLEGWRCSAPVRVGNDAVHQRQLDAYGQLLDQSWRWHRRGHARDDDYWRFLVELVEAAIEGWREPDSGIWEWRAEPRHFVHSKVLSWAAVDRGLRLAEECVRKAPESRWRTARDEIRDAIEEHGYDGERGVFVQAFGESDLDAAVLRLPIVGFVAYDDERMIRTADALRAELSEGGLLRRHDADDGLEGREGAFLPCTFWLAEVLARQGRIEEAQESFDHAVATANDVGLFSEEYDPNSGEMLGNFPQALTHLSHIEATLALAEGRAGDAGGQSQFEAVRPG